MPPGVGAPPARRTRLIGISSIGSSTRSTHVHPPGRRRPPTSPRRPPTAAIDFYDWKDGHWAVFFSHPADYTPVCTTELGRTAALNGEFAKRDVKSIAISVDPIEDHRGWAGDIGDVGGTDLNFPIIADPDRTVVRLVRHDPPGEGDTSTVRSVFIIDPSNKVRLTFTYPKSVGRNFDEILRTIDALQLTDPPLWRRRPTGPPANG